MSVESTYAEALYEAASDAEAVTRVADDLKAFTAAVDASPDLAHTLNSPNLDSAVKKSVIGKLTEGSTPVLSNFLQVLVDRGRLGDLEPIAGSFQARVAEATGSIEITAVTAIPLDDEMRSKIVQRIELQTGRTAALTERVDEDLIGGIVLEVGEIRVDGSLRSRLDTLRLTVCEQRINHDAEDDDADRNADPERQHVDVVGRFAEVGDALGHVHTPVGRRRAGHDEPDQAGQDFLAHRLFPCEPSRLVLNWICFRLRSHTNRRHLAENFECNWQVSDQEATGPTPSGQEASEVYFKREPPCNPTDAK